MMLNSAACYCALRLGKVPTMDTCAVDQRVLRWFNVPAHFILVASKENIRSKMPSKCHLVKKRHRTTSTQVASQRRVWNGPVKRTIWSKMWIYYVGVEHSQPLSRVYNVYKLL